MIELVINAKDELQRVDKYIMRVLPGAGKSLIYKQIRKKNITLNGKKIDGSEKLKSGDKLQLFFSEATYEKFKNPEMSDTYNAYERALEQGRIAYTDKIQNIEIVYEDENVIFMNKPQGILTQADDKNLYSLNEWLIGYLESKGEISLSTMSSFKPSVLNRLDRNTGGLVAGSKSIKGAIVLSDSLKNRTCHKYYLTYVSGALSGEGTLKGYHRKNTASNKVIIKREPEAKDNPDDYDEVITKYKVLRNIKQKNLSDISLLEIELITGKSHQIRAHLSSIGHPIIGDYKYGDKNGQEMLKKQGINGQMLYAYKFVMPDNMPGEMSDLSGKIITCNVPENWRNIDGNLEK